MPGIASYICGTYLGCGGAKLDHRPLLLCLLFQLEDARVQLSHPVNRRMLFWSEFSCLGMLRDWRVLFFGCVTFGRHVSAEQRCRAGKEMLSEWLVLVRVSQITGILGSAHRWVVGVFLQQNQHPNNPPLSGSSAFTKNDKDVGFHCSFVQITIRFDPVSVCFVFLPHTVP